MRETLIRSFHCSSLECAAVLLIWLCLLPCEVAASDNAAPVQSDPPLERVVGPAPAQAEQRASEFEERLVLVDINRQQLDDDVLELVDKGGVVYFSEKDLQRWRLRLPDASAAVVYLGEKYYPLSAIAGVSQVFDPTQLKRMIEAPPEAFVETARTAEYAKLPAAVKPGPGGFINYNLFAAHSQDAMQRSGLFEFGYFNRFGVGTTNVLANDLGQDMHTTRLDTTWTVDYPDSLKSARFGDLVNRAGTWGRSVRFGGIQYGTNFATQPGLVTFLPQSAVGQAVVPSTVDVFINNALVSRQSVPPGPFSIGNLPVVTGAGDVRLVVRDIFGREQVITQQFYASQALLRPGLQESSYELGFVRENFGINSNDYGNALGTGTYRRGMNEHFTGELHGELMRNQATAGAGGDYLMQRAGTISGYIAGSHAPARTGGLLQLGIERQSRPWSLSARTQWMSREFTQIGLLPQQLPPIQTSSANVSYAGGAGGSIGIAYVTQHSRDQSDARIATLSYSVSLGNWASFNVSAVRNLTGDMNTTIFAFMDIPLDALTSLNFNSQSVRGGSAGNGNDFSTTLQRNLPVGAGYGYRLLARSDGSREGTYSLQNNVGTYMLGAAQSGGATATRLEISGGIALLGGDAFFSRNIGQSFAVVRIPGYPNVHLRMDNQLAGVTDAEGNALIPRLRSYDRNVISIVESDLPMDAKIDEYKVDVVPYFRSGVDVTFAIKPSRGATLTINLEDGTPLPAGATVQIVGRSEIYPVGYDGEIYLLGLSPTNRLRASWHGQTCEFDAAYAASDDPLPDLGTYICKGVRQ